MLAEEIIKRIIERGSVIGYAAKLCLNDQEKMHEFIIQSADKFPSPTMEAHFGKELVAEIEFYKKQHILKSLLQEAS